MQVKCIRARMGVEVGDVVDVPDGAQVSPLYYEPVEEAPAGLAPDPAPAEPARPADVTVKGGAGK